MHAASHSTLGLINAAADRARAQGQRWTPQRAAVYAALLASNGAVGAYDLLDVLARQQALRLQPASLYRSLDALQALGLIVKIESLNAWRACHHPDEEHQHVFLVCDGCGNTAEIADAGAAEKLSTAASAFGFHTSRQVLELHGNCRSCSATP